MRFILDETQSQIAQADNFNLLYWFFICSDIPPGAYVAYWWPMTTLPIVLCDMRTGASTPVWYLAGLMALN